MYNFITSLGSGRWSCRVDLFRNLLCMIGHIILPYGIWILDFIIHSLLQEFGNQLLPGNPTVYSTLLYIVLYYLFLVWEINYQQFSRIILLSPSPASLWHYIYNFSNIAHLSSFLLFLLGIIIYRLIYHTGIFISLGILLIISAIIYIYIRFS